MTPAQDPFMDYIIVILNTPFTISLQYRSVTIFIVEYSPTRMVLSRVLCVFLLCLSCNLLYRSELIFQGIVASIRAPGNERPRFGMYSVIQSITPIYLSLLQDKNNDYAFGYYYLCTTISQV